MEYLGAYIFLSVAAASLSAIKCFQIKYADAQKLNKLETQVVRLQEQLAHVDAGAIKDLRAEVQGLKNHYGLAGRR